MVRRYFYYSEAIVTVCPSGIPWAHYSVDVRLPELYYQNTRQVLYYGGYAGGGGGALFESYMVGICSKLNV
jgi:hypothetical protein